MRYFLALFLSFFYCSSAAQYIDSIAPPHIDSLHIDVREEFLATHYKESLELSTEFLAYWESVKNEYPNKKDNWNNYFYAVIENFKSKRRLGIVTKESARAFMSIESEIIERLGKRDIILANFYSISGETNHMILFDRVASVEAARKSIDIRMHNKPTNFKAVMNDYMIMGYGFKRRSQFDSSLYYLEKAHESGKKMIWIDTSMIMINQYAIGTTYQEMKDYKKALEVFKEAYYLGEGAIPKDNSVNVYLINSIAKNSETIGDLETAIEFSFKGLALAKAKPENYTENMHELYETIASLYLLQGKIFQSNAYLDSAFVCLEKNNVPNGRASLMSLKADLATDIEEKIRLHELAHQYCQSEPDCKSEEYHTVLTNIAKAYEQKGDHQSALNLGLKAKTLQESSHELCDKCMPTTYSVIARSLASLGMFDDAIKHSKLSIETEKKISSDTSFMIAQYSNELARYQTLNGNSISAEAIYKNNLQLLESTVGKGASTVIEAQNNLAELYYQKGEYAEALSYAKQSFNSLNDKRHKASNTVIEPQLIMAKCHAKLMNQDSCMSIVNQLLTEQGFKNFGKGAIPEYDIPDHDLWHAYKALVEIILIEDYFERSTKNQIGKIRTAISLIDRLRALNFFEASEKNFQKEIRTFHNWAINKLGETYNIENDSELFSLIFECMEQSKSIMINRNFVRTRSIRNNDISQDIIDEEKSILMEYQYYYEKYESVKFNKNDSLTNLYISKMYELENKKQDLLNILKAEYPKYYSNRHDQNIISLKQIEKVVRQNDLDLLVFHWGEESLWAMSIGADGTSLQNIPLKEISSDIAEFKLSVQSQGSNESEYKKNLDRFTSVVNVLSKKLLKVLPKDDSNFNLILIPDGGLVNFPFDLLFTEEVEEVNSYKDLPYLLRQNSVSYLGSASQLLQSSTNVENRKGYLGFAPSYGSHDKSEEGDLSVGRDLDLVELRFNTLEVESASDIFGGEMLLGENATVSSFTELASAYDYLHLAMHAKINNEFPLETHLSFAYDDTRGAADKLEVREISKMQLESKLVVLSACQTNVGEAILGEGVLGIARAFNLASCQNLILSSWVVDDKSSCDLMETFFENFNRTKNPAASLRDAKLNFISNSNESNTHPAYWAAFSYYGMPLNLVGDSFLSSTTMLVASMICLGMFFLLFVWKQVSSPSNS